MLRTVTGASRLETERANALDLGAGDRVKAVAAERGQDVAAQHRLVFCEGGRAGQVCGRPGGRPFGQGGWRRADPELYRSVEMMESLEAGLRGFGRVVSAVGYQSAGVPVPHPVARVM
jgi:hypothetical protein